MAIKLTKQEAIERCINAHPEEYKSGKYTLDKFVYNGNRGRSIFNCSVHGEFEQTFGGHVSGKGCKKCADEKFIEYSAMYKLKQKKIYSDKFIELANKKYKNGIIYLSSYVNRDTKIKVQCKKCGHIFEMFPDIHLNNNEGCTKCKYLYDSYDIHPHYNEWYDISETKYTGKYNSIKIRCKKCNEYFDVQPFSFKKGIHGCPKCTNTNSSEYKTQEFIKRLFTKQPQFKSVLDFTDSVYNGMNDDISVRCIKHDHIFSKKASLLLGGYGCPACTQGKKTKESFILKLIDLFPDIEDYLDFTDMVFKGMNNNVNIHCKTCDNDIHVRANNLLNGQGCPICKESKGEKEIRLVLKKHNILNISQKWFSDCRNKNPLPFDFYLLDYNICIEFQGKQHYTVMTGILNKNFTIQEQTENLKRQQIHDKIKYDYCTSNNIKLIVIPYWDISNIEHIILSSVHG